MIRLWAASRLVSEEQCLDELALVEPEIAQLNPSIQQSRVIPLPADAASPSIAHTDNGVADPPSDGLVDSRRFEPSREFLGHLRVFVRPSLGELGTTGIVLGVAAGIGRCLAFHAVTAVGGAQANEQVADRLVWLVDGVAKSLNVRAAEQRPTRNR